MLICFPTGEPLDEFSFLLGRLFEVEVWSHMVAWFNLNFWNDLSLFAKWNWILGQEQLALCSRVGLGDTWSARTPAVSIHVTLGKVILLTVPERSLPSLEFPKTVERSQRRLGQHGRPAAVISSSEGQVRFWHAVISMQTRGSTQCLELSSGGWSRSWWVSPSWLSAIPREESEWTTLCVIIWVGFSLSIA